MVVCAHVYGCTRVQIYSCALGWGEVARAVVLVLLRGCSAALSVSLFVP